MKAVVVGATGATGKELVELLLQDEAVEEVVIFLRRETGLTHPKLRTHLINFDNPREWKQLVKGDVLFSCLGTTLKAAGSKAAQWKIDYDYQFEFAKAARENNIPAYVLVSAGNASPNSVFFYAKMKGRLEQDVKRLEFPRLIIFNPPVLIRPESDRAGEVMAVKFISLLNRFGLLESQKPLPTGTLARAMVRAAKLFKPGSYAIDSAEIRQLAAN